MKHFGLSMLMLFLLWFNAATAGPSASKVIYSKGDEIYLTNGFGEMPTKVLKKISRGKQGRHEAFDSYFQASLSPNEKFITAIRVTNHTRYDSDPARETHEALVYSIDDQQEYVFAQEPAGSGDALSSPIFSKDGNKIYFLKINNLYVFTMATQTTSKIHQFPRYASVYPTHADSHYIKLSRDGTKIFAILNSEDFLKEAIWETELNNSNTKMLWRGSMGDLFNRVGKVPDVIADDVATALFGSRDFPFRNPQFSADGSFYYYFTYREGFFARYWIGGYSKGDAEPFVVKTLEWAFYTE